VTPRVNIANDVSPRFVARDSAQVATPRAPADVQHGHPGESECPSLRRYVGVGRASGGRLGFVTGEDATEVANPPTTCTTDCQAQNQVRGRLAVLGHPFPVPAGSRLVPRVAAIAP
jgi:hypothetical protein